MSVINRLVVLLPGFEHMPVEAHHRRFLREATKTAPVYDMALIEDGALKVSSTEDTVSIGEFRLKTAGTNWSAQTDFVLYGLGDINLFYASRNPFVRILSGIVALIDFIFTGTFFRFISTSWRYALFFLYPLVIMGSIVGLSFGAGGIAQKLTGDPTASITVVIITALALLVLAAQRMHFLLIMDDWTFARDMARDRRPDITAKLQHVIANAADRISRAPATTEVVVAAHSMGAICALQILDEALRKNNSRRYGLLTVGSSLLKIALHPAAKALRTSVETVARSRAVWVDAQSLTDPMNFYKSNPVRDLNISDAESPVLVRVRFRHQLCDETYKAIRHNFFRVHRQFVYGVEKRTAYSWHAILCGPESFSDVATSGGLACECTAHASSSMKIPETAAV
ncbi:hypothetical protein [Phyllobacterium myrsinacearum]|uniref:Alpha/beta hydrolase n=1 Tax=Phyllobacterium myrsinacearum TaxID=28101 RepID=A0A839EVM8_9HYPH|nr:hypothetical protein [Phyllobacterium myrsinacearum]MBA8880610.1 hypothetical protein [Phyllobacterium myrsinacearum]